MLIWWEIFELLYFALKYGKIYYDELCFILWLMFLVYGLWFLIFVGLCLWFMALDICWNCFVGIILLETFVGLVYIDPLEGRC